MNTPSESKVLEYTINNQVNVEKVKTIPSRMSRYRPKTEHLRNIGKFECTCNHCGYRLLEGKYWKSGEINKHWTVVNYFYKMIKKGKAYKWQGCFGVNVHLKTNELRLECHCGNSWKNEVGIIRQGFFKGFTFEQIR